MLNNWVLEFITAISYLSESCLVDTCAKLDFDIIVNIYDLAEVSLVHWVKIVCLALVTKGTF